MTEYTIKVDKLGRAVDGTNIPELGPNDSLRIVYEPQNDDALDAVALGTKVHKYIDKLYERHGPNFHLTDMDFGEIERRVMGSEGYIPDWAKPHVKLEQLRRGYGMSDAAHAEWVSTRGGIDSPEFRSRIHRANREQHPIFVMDLETCGPDLDERIERTLRSKHDLLKGPNDGEADPETETSDVRSEQRRVDGRCDGARTGRWRFGETGNGPRQSSQSSEELARATRAGDRSRGHHPARENAPTLGETDRGSTVSIFDITIKKEPMGAVAVIKAGSLWDGQGYQTGYTATAPELDRLIAELAKTRDQIRAMNRPKHFFGQTP